MFIGPRFVFHQLVLNEKVFMKDIVAMAQGKLDDPVMRDWAIRKYEDICKYSQEIKEAMEQGWFDDLSLRRWIETEASGLQTLFRLVPGSRFKESQQLIFNRWGEWKGNMSLRASPILAELQPEQAGNVFTGYLYGKSLDHEKLLGIIESLEKLPEGIRVQVFEQINNILATLKGDEFFVQSLIPPFIKMSYRLNLPFAESLFEKAIKNSSSDDRSIRSVLTVACNSLGILPYLCEYALDIYSKYTEHNFEAIACLFKNDVPLNECDHILVKSNSLEHALELMSGMNIPDEKSDRIQAVIKQYKKHFPQDDQQVKLTCFVLGAILQKYLLKKLNLIDVPLDRTIQILSLDCKTPHFEQILKYLCTFKKEDIIASVLDAAEHLGDTYGKQNLIRLAGRLEYAEFSPLLISSISNESADFICEEASLSLIKIGTPAQKRLVEQWNDLDTSQKIYGSSIISDIGGQYAVSFLLDHFDDLFAEEPDRWCSMAQDNPDARILNILQPEIYREQGYIDKTFYILSRLLDFSYPEMEKLGGRVMNEHNRFMSMLYGGAKHSINKTITLSLRCELCGDKNQYAIHNLIVSEESGGDPLVGDELPCASCNEYPEFEFTPDASLVITAKLIEDLGAKVDGTWSKDQSAESDPLNISMFYWDGENRPVTKIVANYKKGLKKTPDDITQLLGLGHIYACLKKRKRSAIYFKKAIKLEPVAVEGGLWLAESLFCEGKNKEAFNVLNSMFDRRDQWRFFLSGNVPPREICKGFSDLYNKTRQASGEDTIPALHPSFYEMSDKVGRNDSCPCGSGKKFKKCCLS